VQKVEEYRRRATECHQLARNAKTPEIRTVYEELAQVWAKMAGERLELILPQHLRGNSAKDSDRPKRN
jgi:hypothetical protein